MIDGAGAPLTTGVKFDLPFDFACTLNMVTLLADQAGSLSLDIWKNTYANYPPIAGNSICGSTKPTLGNVIKSQDGVLFGWNKTINAGDVLRFNVDSAATLTRVSVSLRVTRV